MERNHTIANAVPSFEGPPQNQRDSELPPEQCILKAFVGIGLESMLGSKREAASPPLNGRLARWCQMGLLVEGQMLVDYTKWNGTGTCLAQPQIFELLGEIAFVDSQFLGGFTVGGTLAHRAGYHIPLKAFQCLFQCGSFVGFC